MSLKNKLTSHGMGPSRGGLQFAEQTSSPVRSHAQSTLAEKRKGRSMDLIAIFGFCIFMLSLMCKNEKMYKGFAIILFAFTTISALYLCDIFKMPKENITAKDVLPKMRLAVMHFIMYVASFALAGLAKIHERKRLTSHGT